jgi:DNA-binding GntR family transcriptional regulator
VSAPASIKRARPFTEPASTEDIVEHLSAAVMQQRLAPGTRLVEEHLGEFFGVSRTKVRQALFQLASTKLVELKAGRGAFIAQPTVREAREVFEARRVIECSIVVRFVEVAGDADIAKLRQHLRREQESVRKGDVRTRTRLLGDFHLLIAERAGNAVLAELLADLVSRSSLIEVLYQSSEAASCSSDEHAALLDALERRDAQRAVRVMSEHITHVEQGLVLKEPAQAAVDLRAALNGVRK